MMLNDVLCQFVTAIYYARAIKTLDHQSAVSSADAKSLLAQTGGIRCQFQVYAILLVGSKLAIQLLLR